MTLEPEPNAVGKADLKHEAEIVYEADEEAENDSDS